MEEIIIDTNGWIQIIEGVQKDENKKVFGEYITSKNYNLIFSEMVASEFLDILTKPEKIKTLKYPSFFYFKGLFELAQSKNLNLKFLSNQPYRSRNTYYRLADMLFKKNKLWDHCAKENIDFHVNDLAIFLSLKDLGYKPIKFFCGDGPLKKALENSNIKDCLKKENIEVEFISFQRETH